VHLQAGILVVLEIEYGHEPHCDGSGLVEPEIAARGFDASLRENQVKSEVEDAINFVRSSMGNELEQFHSGDSNDRRRSGSSGLKYTAAQYKGWLEGIRSLMVAPCCSVIKTAIALTSALSADVTRYAPTYSRIIMHERVNMSLAQRHLLGWASRDVLTTSAVSLFKSIAGCSRLSTHMVGLMHR
jgi:hypothetical protein